MLVERSCPTLRQGPKGRISVGSVDFLQAYYMSRETTKEPKQNLTNIRVSHPPNIQGNYFQSEHGELKRETESENDYIASEKTVGAGDLDPEPKPRRVTCCALSDSGGNDHKGR